MDYSCEQKIILCGKSGCPLWWPTVPLAVALDDAVDPSQGGANGEGIGQELRAERDRGKHAACDDRHLHGRRGVGVVVPVRKRKRAGSPPREPDCVRFANQRPQPGVFAAVAYQALQQARHRQIGSTGWLLTSSAFTQEFGVG